MEKTIIYRERNSIRMGMNYLAVPPGGQGKYIKRFQAEEMIAAGAAVWSSDLKKQGRGNCHCQVCGRQIEANIGKIALASGFARDVCGDISVKQDYSEEIRSQNMDVDEAFMETFKRVLEENGYGFAIKKYWSYID